MAQWLGRRSRLVRSLICAGIALVWVVGMALALYSALFNIPPERLQFGPINAYNLPAVLLVALTLIGILFYWVGWRVMIGFDFEDEPLQPGRPAALWLVIGAVLLALDGVGILIALLTAVQPS